MLIHVKCPSLLLLSRHFVLKNKVTRTQFTESWVDAVPTHVNFTVKPVICSLINKPYNVGCLAVIREQFTSIYCLK